MSANKEADKLVALEAGANDFIRMPLDRTELLAREIAAPAEAIVR